MNKTAMDNELKREMTVGAFAFLVVLALFCFSIFVTGNLFWEKGQDVRILFPGVMGLRDGDKVVVRGMAVGEVKKLEFDDETGMVRVTCHLNQHISIYADYKATIVPTSVLGGRHLQIDEGTREGKPLPRKTALVGTAPNDLAKDASLVVSALRREIEQGSILPDLRAFAAQAREISEKINHGEGSLGAMINDDKLYADIKATSASLKEVSRRLEAGEGLLGKMLVEDEPLYDQAKLLFQDIRAAVDDLRETAPILTFTSVFFGAF